MTITEQFAAQVRAAIVQTPFVVAPAERGFLVEFNLHDDRWWLFLQHHHISATMRYTVTVDEERRRFRINDTLKRIRWRSGLANGGLTASFGASIQSGRVIYRNVLITGTGPDGGFVEYSPERERARIKQIGIDLGLKPGMGAHALIGLWVAVGAVPAVAIVGGIVWGIVTLLNL